MEAFKVVASTNFSRQVLVAGHIWLMNFEEAVYTKYTFTWSQFNKIFMHPVPDLHQRQAFAI